MYLRNIFSKTAVEVNGDLKLRLGTTVTDVILLLLTWWIRDVFEKKFPVYSYLG